MGNVLVIAYFLRNQCTQGKLSLEKYRSVGRKRRFDLYIYVYISIQKKSDAGILWNVVSVV